MRRESALLGDIKAKPQMAYQMVLFSSIYSLKYLTA